jgi:hypothetical protein
MPKLSWVWASFSLTGAPLLVTAILLMQCGRTSPTEPTQPTAGAAIYSEEHLRSGCYSWPGEASSSPAPVGNPRLGLTEGDPAIDFTLEDPTGVRYRLSDLLGKKPILLVLGSLTCDLYRRSAPLLTALAHRAFDQSQTYAEVVHFVTVYVVEPHPQSPDPSPYTGEVWENVFSAYRQPRTRDERAALASEAQASAGGGQRMLVDELTPDSRDNPVWCTYGPAPNPAYLIAPDGIVVAAQMRLDVSEMKASVEELLSLPPD